MELLRADQVLPEPCERVFRHGAFGPFLLWTVLAAPLAGGLVLRAELTRAAAALPWFTWIFLGPLVLLGAALYLLCLQAALQVVQRALLPSNWLMRVSSAGLVLKLRSFQNAHFPEDGPTVVRFAWGELVAARRLVERVQSLGGRRADARKPWLELELRSGVDSDALARLLDHERERPAPQASFLGVTSRARFGHVPVFVAGPGLVRVEWLGRGMLRALEPHLAIGAAREAALGKAADGGTTDLDTRLRELCLRGEHLSATALARTELGLSLLEAKTHVERLARAAA